MAISTGSSTGLGEPEEASLEDRDDAEPYMDRESSIDMDSPLHSPLLPPDSSLSGTTQREHEELPRDHLKQDDYGRLKDTQPKVAKGTLSTSKLATSDAISRMHRFSLYETSTRFFLVGADVLDRKFRILKVDRTSEPGVLNVSEDNIVYTKKEMNQLLNAVDEGNRLSGGLKLRSSTWGLLGFIRFTGEYYMLVVTKRSQVAMIGGHYVYQIDGTELISLTTTGSSRFKTDRNSEEGRFIGILNNLDLTRSFYFSYSYDITQTLQHNILYARQAQQERRVDTSPQDQPTSPYNEMFVWNHYLLNSAADCLKNPYDWCIPIIHGFIDQATLSVYGRTVYVTIIARRSRFFAGARFLKRGTNDLGFVANDVESEQIVSDMVTTSFHAPGKRLWANPNYTSYVQHRGSIPLYWSQDSTGVTPKPDIELDLIDPFYSAAALHFDDLFRRYGAPVYVLNLVKARERTPRESKLLKEFTNMITYLNQFLPDERKIIYKAWDMSRASKSRDQDVISTLESIAASVLDVTGFFHNGDGCSSLVQMQNGVARTNCIDCLDRTNAAQFVIGKLALGHQLHALGIIEGTSIEYDTDAVNLYTHMFHSHGDSIAIQYGGSHLVNTMETYRKINQWTSQSRDMVESVKRYYHNSFLDGQRQEAYNLFLGNYIFVQGQPMLWDLSTDYYLHHIDPRLWLDQKRRSYINWFTPSYLASHTMPESIAPHDLENHTLPEIFLDDDYWLEYYKPLALSSFLKIFSFRMNSTLRYLPLRRHDNHHELSPFKVRLAADSESTDKANERKGVTIVDPLERSQDIQKGHSHPTIGSVEEHSLSLHEPPNHHNQPYSPPGILKDSSTLGNTVQSSLPNLGKNGKPAKDSLAVAQWTMNQFVTNSLSPSVADSEMAEYGRYISHPLNLPLVVSTEVPASSSLEFLTYINSVSLNASSIPHSHGEDIADYDEFLHVEENPLTVTDADTPKKRYKAYRQWLKGKSLFKQQRIDP
ncbi:phosphatidylinositol-3,5-bisphosphate 5-phosphatase [Agyrium rufum]|nr:phosphatidylinositol-3,5-bisphosphate 5-phosphatase [Agyrium rufum]